MDPAALGLRIRRARERRRWSQERLAKELGVGTRTVGRWERGEVTAPRSSIGAIEFVLGIDLAGDQETDPREEELRILVSDLPPDQADELLQLYRHLRDRHHVERAG